MHQPGAYVRVAVAGIAAVTAVGCSTTHELGQASLPSTVATLEHVGAQPGAFVHVDPLPGARTPDSRIRVVTADGVELEAPGPPVVVPFQRVRSISTYDRGEGAFRGAVTGGITGAVIFGVLAGLIARQNEIAARDGGGGPDSAGFVAGATAVGALVGGLAGGGLGALAGYEDRYVLAPEPRRAAPP